MLQLVLAILCSVTVGVLIKYARMKGIHIAQSIAVNYIITTTLTYFLLKPDFKGESLSLYLCDSKLKFTDCFFSASKIIRIRWHYSY